MSETSFHTIAQDLLAKQQILSAQMLKLLKREYEMLCTNVVDPLNQINQDKHPIILELNEVNQRWSSLLETNSVKLSPENITSYLKDYDQVNQTKLATLWSNLQQLAKKCQKANTINGSIITLRNQASQQTLAILRGQISENIVYGPSGNKSTGYLGGSSLAKA